LLLNILVFNPEERFNANKIKNDSWINSFDKD